MKTATQPSELGPYRPVSDSLVLAALDRAQRHSLRGYDHGVRWPRMVEHLGFVHRPDTTFKLRHQVARLRASGLIERRKHEGYTLWRLTSDGRKALTRARRKRDDLTLPEAPQHRVWRSARDAAVEHIDGVREQMRATLADASALLESDTGGDSRAWTNLSYRLHNDASRLAAATYSLREWREPDDARADTRRGSSPSAAGERKQAGEKQ